MTFNIQILKSGLKKEEDFYDWLSGFDTSDIDIIEPVEIIE